MHPGRARRLRGLLLTAVAIVGIWGFPSWAVDAPAQEPARAGNAVEKDLEPAVAKAREGKGDDALALIKQQAPKHPDWPPAHVILARILYRINQPVAARRALEQSAATGPNEPEVFLTMGAIALSEGRYSDARLNFDHASPMIDAGHWSADKEKMLRRECLAGLASVAEAREDWKTTALRLSAWLELEPKNGQVRQRLGRALFMAGKTDEAYKALTQAVTDMPALEPATEASPATHSRRSILSLSALQWPASIIGLA